MSDIAALCPVLSDASQHAGLYRRLAEGNWCHRRNTVAHLAKFRKHSRRNISSVVAPGHDRSISEQLCSSGGTNFADGDSVN